MPHLDWVALKFRVKLLFLLSAWGVVRFAVMSTRHDSGSRSVSSDHETNRGADLFGWHQILTTWHWVICALLHKCSWELTKVNESSNVDVIATSAIYVCVVGRDQITPGSASVEHHDFNYSSESFTTCQYHIGLDRVELHVEMCTSCHSCSRRFDQHCNGQLHL